MQSQAGPPTSGHWIACSMDRLRDVDSELPFPMSVWQGESAGVEWSTPLLPSGNCFPFDRRSRNLVCSRTAGLTVRAHVPCRHEQNGMLAMLPSRDPPTHFRSHAGQGAEVERQTGTFRATVPDNFELNGTSVNKRAFIGLQLRERSLDVLAWNSGRTV